MDGDAAQKKVFANNLMRLLEVHNKTQREVADAIHENYSTFNTWCTGFALPRMHKVQAIAEYFGVPKSALIDEPTGTAAVVPIEEVLLEHYRELNAEGRAKATAYIIDLAGNEKYRVKKRVKQAHKVEVEK